MHNYAYWFRLLLFAYVKGGDFSRQCLSWHLYHQCWKYSTFNKLSVISWRVHRPVHKYTRISTSWYTKINVSVNVLILYRVFMRMRKKQNCANSKDLNESAPLLSEEIHHQILRVRTAKIQTYFLSMESGNPHANAATNHCSPVR